MAKNIVLVPGGFVVGAGWKGVYKILAGGCNSLLGNKQQSQYDSARQRAGISLRWRGTRLPFIH